MQLQKTNDCRVFLDGVHHLMTPVPAGHKRVVSVTTQSGKQVTGIFTRVEDGALLIGQHKIPIDLVTPQSFHCGIARLPANV